MKKININDDIYPQRLIKIKDPPQNLYVEGNENILNENSIAIIGSRNCSKYGIDVAKYFSKELSNNKICIISGMAIGIDTAAHSGAVENKGKTIAVLPSGLKNVYPKQNKKLFEKIIQTGGAVISEYEENEEATYNKFIERNRIVSGIALGTLVVEAGYRSGTTITARMTKEQNKKVFCIPSNIESSYGLGTNKLIQAGAKLVTSVDQILEEYELFIEYKKQNKQEEIIEEQKEIEIKKEYKDVFEQISDIPIHINEIRKNVNKNIEDINFILTMLEMEGLIEQLPGKEFIIKRGENYCMKGM